MAKAWSKFQVDQCQTYERYPMARPETAPQEVLAKHREMLAKPPGTTPKRAIWIAHGMGQQVPFETLEQLAEGVTSTAQTKKIKVSAPTFRQVLIGDTRLQRVELTFQPDAAPAREVHLYECYWAPKTEGAVALKDVIGFLWDGGTRGLINSFVCFQRALFGTMATFKLTWRTPTFLLMTLALLASLMAINAIIVALGASITGIAKMPANLPIQAITAVAAVVIAVVITFGVVLFVAGIARPTIGTGRSWGRTIRNLTWFGVAFTGASLIIGAVFMAVMFWFHYQPAWLTVTTERRMVILANLSSLTGIVLAVIARAWRRAQVSQTSRTDVGWPPQFVFYSGFLLHLGVIAGALLLVGRAGMGEMGVRLAAVVISVVLWLRGVLVGIVGTAVATRIQAILSSGAWVWPFLALISAAARNILVEYVGDVTAYVASNRIDRFDALRAAIKALAQETAKAVYAAKASGSNDFEYEKVAIVGHSLGSVIAYDTLNRLIADDALSSKGARVVDRTCVLLTFGSPLDKTAFFFSMMGKTTQHIREQLAAVVQPLIEDRDCRERIPWRNVYSRNDIVSGSLDFYQFPDDHPADVQQVRKVENTKDEDALVPLVAHVEYWANPTVWNCLLEKVLDLPAASAARMGAGA